MNCRCGTRSVHECIMCDKPWCLNCRLPVTQRYDEVKTIALPCPPCGGPRWPTPEEIRGIQKAVTEVFEGPAAEDGISWSMVLKVFDLAVEALAARPVIWEARNLERGCDCEYDHRCSSCSAVLSVKAELANYYRNKP
jgi:hypothetical protein